MIPGTFSPDGKPEVWTADLIFTEENGQNFVNVGCYIVIQRDIPRSTLADLIHKTGEHT